jgi:type IV pilus assembly protein PilC
MIDQKIWSSDFAKTEIRFFDFTKTDDEITLLYRELAMMAVAGIPTIEGLDTLISESGHGKARRVLSALKLQLETKDDIETLIIKYPEYYNKAFLYILKNTEPGDELSRFLNNMADELERRSNLKKRMLAAIRYPLVVFCIAVIISLILFTFVIPVFEDLYASFGSALPVPTRFVVFISELVKTYILLILVIVAVIFVILFKFKRLLLSLLSRVPLVGKILEKIAMLQFTSYLSILLGIKVPIKEAVRYAALAIDNPSFSKEIENMGMQMTDGGSLKEVMKQIPIFPSLMLQVVAVGEKTGRLDHILSELSKYYSKDVDT